MLKADFYVKYGFLYIKGWLYLKFMALLMEAKMIMQREKCQGNHCLHYVIAVYSCFMDLLQVLKGHLKMKRIVRLGALRICFQQSTLRLMLMEVPEPTLGLYS